MQITLKDLREWAKNSTPVKYKNVIYKTFYNGRVYQLFSIENGQTIPIYKKSRGVYGLKTNIK